MIRFEVFLFLLHSILSADETDIYTSSFFFWLQRVIFPFPVITVVQFPTLGSLKISTNLQSWEQNWTTRIYFQGLQSTTFSSRQLLLKENFARFNNLPFLPSFLWLQDEILVSHNPGFIISQEPIFYIKSGKRAGKWTRRFPMRSRDEGKRITGWKERPERDSHNHDDYLLDDGKEG